MIIFARFRSLKYHHGTIVQPFLVQWLPWAQECLVGGVEGAAMEPWHQILETHLVTKAQNCLGDVRAVGGTVISNCIQLHWSHVVYLDSKDVQASLATDLRTYVSYWCHVFFLQFCVASVALCLFGFWHFLQIFLAFWLLRCVLDSVSSVASWLTSFCFGSFVDRRRSS